MIFLDLKVIHETTRFFGILTFESSKTASTSSVLIFPFPNSRCLIGMKPFRNHGSWKIWAAVIRYKNHVKKKGKNKQIRKNKNKVTVFNIT